MKLILFTLLCFTSIIASAQSFGTLEQRARLEDVKLKDSSIQKKWYISTYTSLEAGFIGFRGGSASYVAAPMGIQLNRILNKNFTAFAGVSLAPTYLNFNQRFIDGDTKGFSNSFMAGNPSQFTINPAAYVGLGYTNDAQTFQIQGRISVQQGNYFTNPADFRNFRNLDRQLKMNNGIIPQR